MGLFDLFSKKKVEIKPHFNGRYQKKAEADGSYEIICPYCLEHFKHTAVLYKKVSCQTTPVEEIKEDKLYCQFYEDRNIKVSQMDENSTYHKFLAPAMYRQYLNVDSEMLKEIEFIDDRSLFDYSRKNPIIIRTIKNAVGDRLSKTAYRVCPYCHHKLKDAAGVVPSYVYMVLGVTHSGKTVFMSRLIDVLKTAFSSPTDKMGFTSLSFGNETWKKVYHNYRSNQYPLIIENTQVKYKDPLLINIKNNKTNKEALIIFYDYPGEACMEDLEFNNLIGDRIIEKSDAYLIFYDALSFDMLNANLRSQEDHLLANNIRLNFDEASNMKMSTFLSEKSELILNKPKSVVISKIDLLRYTSSNYLQNINIAEEDKRTLVTNKEISKSNDKIDSQDMYTLIHQAKKIMEQEGKLNDLVFINEYSIFPISTTGAIIDGNDISSAVALPINVHWPMIWHLAQIGLLEINEDEHTIEELYLG